MYFAVLVDHWVKMKESKKIDKLFCQGTKNPVEHEGGGLYQLFFVPFERSLKENGEVEIIYKIEFIQ